MFEVLKKFSLLSLCVFMAWAQAGTIWGEDVPGAAVAGAGDLSEAARLALVVSAIAFAAFASVRRRRK